MAPDKRRAPPGWSGAPSRDVEFAGYDLSRVTHPTYQSQAHPNANAVDRKRHLIPISQIAASRVRSVSDSVPADFDTTANPIIATHWFGFRPIGMVIVPIVRRLESLREASNAPA